MTAFAQMARTSASGRLWALTFRKRIVVPRRRGPCARTPWPVHTHRAPSALLARRPPKNPILAPAPPPALPTVISRCHCQSRPRLRRCSSIISSSSIQSSAVYDQAYLPSPAKTTFAQIDGSTRRGRYLVGARHPPAPSQLICIKAYRSPS